MIRYAITFDAANTLGAAISVSVLPRLNQAVRAVAQQAATDWQEAVMRGRMWSGEKDAYAKSITWQMTGDFKAAVESDYKFAAEIENGRPARDLKKMLDTSTKVRRTKDGRRFLVIPMRHNVSSMPAAVSSLAGSMSQSSVTGMGKRPSGQVTHLSPRSGMSPAPRALQTPFLSNSKTGKTMTVASRQYAWGDRVTKAALKEAGLGHADQRKFAGMVRMKANTPGSTKSSGYLTFRIMMEGSSGWIVRPQPGQYILKGVADALAPKAQAAFTAAVSRTTSG